jgi:hypothetical protein
MLGDMTPADRWKSIVVTKDSIMSAVVGAGTMSLLQYITGVETDG